MILSPVMATLAAKSARSMPAYSLPLTSLQSGKVIYTAHRPLKNICHSFLSHLQFSRHASLVTRNRMVFEQVLCGYTTDYSTTTDPNFLIL